MYRDALTFEAPVLAGVSWSTIDIVGARPGPRVAVIAGIHPNEVAAIEAVFRVVELIDPDRLAGVVSLLPIVNEPGYPVRAETICPVDGKNINFAFPGGPTGSFSEVLANVLLDQWAADAACLVDLHGGDLREEMTRFVAWQSTGDAAFDARQLALARSFQASFAVRLDPAALGKPGRSVTARAARRQHGVFAEGGSHGLLVDDDVRYHRDGILGVLAHHGMIDHPPPCHQPLLLAGYRFIESSRTGWSRSLVRAGQWVERGQPLAHTTDRHGQPAETVVAPESGYILWRVTHPIVAHGDPLVGLGTLST